MPSASVVGAPPLGHYKMNADSLPYVNQLNYADASEQHRNAVDDGSDETMLRRR